MAKQVKKLEATSTAFSHLHLAGVFLPLLFATFYLPQADYVPNVATKLLALSVAPGFILSVNYFSKRRNRVVFPRNLVLAFLVFVGYLLFRAVVSGALWQGLVGTSNRNLGVLTYIVFFLFVWIGFQLAEGTNSKILVYLITLLGVGEASIANYEYLVGDKSAAITGTFNNSNPVSFLLGIIATSVFAFLVYEKKRHTAEYFALVLSLLWILIALYVCGSQQGLITFTLIAIGLLFTNFSRVLRMNFAKVLFPTFLLALVTFVTISLALPIKDNSQISTNALLERLEIYKSAIKLAIQNPFFGVGVDSFHEKYGQVTLTSMMQLVDNAHSIPLQILSTLGFFGFTLWLTIVFLIFRNTKSGANEEKAEFKFFQLGFFSYLLTGIVGIEHPVIGAVSWLMGGALVKLSFGQELKTKVDKPALGAMKLEKRTILAGSMSLIAISLYLLPQQLVVGKALSDFSERNITSSEFDKVIIENLNRMWNPSLLFTSGEGYISIDQQVKALIVANVMLKNYPDDQRTSTLLFAIANKWNDAKAQELAEQVRDRIFK
jgi:O-antigen ligase